MVLVGRILTLAVTAIPFCSSASAAAPLKISELFSDHMVLQREMPLKVWGTSEPGSAVKVELGETTSQAITDAKGKWLVELPPQQAGGPFKVTVSDDDDTTSLQDVLIGEVWVCSGQSNMDWPLRKSADPEKNISQADYPKIRLFQVPRRKALTPQGELENAAGWKVCSPETIAGFSAVGYYFGRDLHHELEVPVGLIQSTWGGTKVEWWTPAEQLQEFPEHSAQLQEVNAAVTDEELMADYRKKLGPWKQKFNEADPGINQDGSGWADAGLDDSTWTSIQLPGMLSDTELNTYDGSLWYRRTFSVPESHLGKTANLVFCVDDEDDTYINGKRIGSTQKVGKRSYQVPAEVLKPGENSITVRVVDSGKDGGFCGKPEDLYLSYSEGSTSLTIPLRGEWRFKRGIALDDVPGRPAPPNAIRPTVLYNAMIAPLVQFPIRGVIWYQGEGNAHTGQAQIYARNFAGMIDGWRKNWGIGDFPFLFVQLASFKAIEPEPAESPWAELREAQEETLSLTSNVAMASAIDIGEQNDIHPKNKLDVGRRLAKGALALAYGRPVEYMGPIYKSHQVNGNEVTIHFDHAKELKSQNGEELKGFALAGPDKKFVWAEARIVGNTVVVSSSKIQTPTAVRYGWANYSEGNLYNEAELPASPFRTDKP